jgi:hypothetical protein
MPKSYDPIRPKPSRFPPTWVETGECQKLLRLTTDDAQFDLPYVTKDIVRPGVFRVAYRDGRGRWLEVTIHKKRVREMVR